MKWGACFLRRTNLGRIFGDANGDGQRGIDGGGDFVGDSFGATGNEKDDGETNDKARADEMDAHDSKIHESGLI